jgi:uncharacterized RDD family membrane protein YckC
LVFLPLLGLEALLFTTEPAGPASLLTTLLNTALPAIYSVWMVGKYGQTLGKMALKIKVLDGDEEKDIIGYKRAFYRDSVLIILDSLAFLYLLYMWATQGIIATVSANPVLGFINYSVGIWGIAELITMFSSERRRAIHDILANSVVVKLEKTAEAE